MSVLNRNDKLALSLSLTLARITTTCAWLVFCKRIGLGKPNYDTYTRYHMVCLLLFFLGKQLQKDNGVTGGLKRGITGGGDGGRAGGQKKSSLFQLEVLTEKLEKV